MEKDKIRQFMTIYDGMFPQNVTPPQNNGETKQMLNKEKIKI